MPGPRRDRRRVVPSRTKRSRNRGRMWRTSSRRARIPKPIALKPHTFVERLPNDVISLDNEGSGTGLFKSFALNQIPQVASYINLFEYYTINKIVVEFRYKGAQTPQNIASSTAGFNRSNEVNPILYFKVDHNDITADNIATMKQSMKTKEIQLTNDKPNFTIQLKPAVQAEAYKSSVATTYIPKWGQLLSVNDSTVPHYGLKCYGVAFKSSDTDPGKIEVSYKMYFTMKNNE